jgi:hypothetical protein
MTVRLGVAAAAMIACAGAVFAGVAVAQEAKLPATPEESRAVLEQSCRDDGMATETCTCLGDFVLANFSERELAGAAYVFSDPALTTDPAAGIAALLTAGYSLEEITAVANRVMTLEEAATTECAVGSGPTESEED